MQPLVDISCSDIVGSRHGLTVDESLYECMYNHIFVFAYCLLYTTIFLCIYAHIFMFEVISSCLHLNLYMDL